MDTRYEGVSISLEPQLPSDPLSLEFHTITGENISRRPWKLLFPLWPRVFRVFVSFLPFVVDQPWAASTVTISLTLPPRTRCIPLPTRTTCHLLTPTNPISIPFLLPFLLLHRPLHDRPVRSDPSASSMRPTRSQAPRTSTPTISVS